MSVLTDMKDFMSDFNARIKGAKTSDDLQMVENQMIVEATKFMKEKFGHDTPASAAKIACRGYIMSVKKNR